MIPSHSGNGKIHYKKAMKKVGRKALVSIFTYHFVKVFALSVDAQNELLKIMR